MPIKRLADSAIAPNEIDTHAVGQDIVDASILETIGHAEVPVQQPTYIAQVLLVPGQVQPILVAQVGV